VVRVSGTQPGRLCIVFPRDTSPLPTVHLQPSAPNRNLPTVCSQPSTPSPAQPSHRCSSGANNLRVVVCHEDWYGSLNWTGV
jgi:hypothetical protein